LFELVITILDYLSGDLKVGRPQKREAEKLIKKCFQLFIFDVIQILNLPKANKENDEKLKINT
jgi:hypothetical protein